MKFAIIGIDTPNSVEVKLTKALKNLGHSVYLLSRDEIVKRYCPTVFKLSYHLTMKYPIDLREILPMDVYDMIIICHNDFVFNNPQDSSTKVLYIHRDMLTYPSCFNPDILAYNYPNRDHIFWHFYPQLWHTPNKIYIHMAVDPEEFNPHREKDLTGLNYVPVKTSFSTLHDKHNDFFWDFIDKELTDQEELYCSNGFVRVNGGDHANYKEYKDYLERSEAFIHLSYSVFYGGRRVLESAACKTLAVIRVNNEEASKYYEELGFEINVNCLMFGINPPIIDNYRECKEYYEYTENAYNLVLERHTYDNRAQQIAELIE